MFKHKLIPVFWALLLTLFFPLDQGGFPVNWSLYYGCR